MPKILAYTVTHGNRNYLSHLIPDIRGAAGCWFDWAVYLGAPSEFLSFSAGDLLNHPQGLGIQYLNSWPENRGQHHATNHAMKLATAEGYDWILRIDDDIQPKTKKFLIKMVERLEELKRLALDKRYRLIASPKILGLKYPLPPIGSISNGQRFIVDEMGILGGACRLMPVPMMARYQAPIYDPVGRGDPESIADYTAEVGGILVRFPDIRIVHRTESLEQQDTPTMALQRRMSKYWPYLGPQV